MIKRKGTKGQTAIYKTQKSKDRARRIPLNTGGELRCSGRVGNSCSTSSTHRVNLFTKPDLGLSWLSYIQRGNTQEMCRKIWLMVAIG